MFKIDTDSPIPVYEQITFSVKAAISAGKLRPGDQLPSIREVASEANVNPNTIAKAFRELEIQGYTLARRGSGIFVAPGALDRARTECERHVGTLLTLVKQQADAAGLDWAGLVRRA